MIIIGSKKLKKFVVCLFTFVTMLVSFFGGAHAKKTCVFPFCTGLITTSWPDFKVAWSD